LPKLIEYYNENKSDDFEILAFHDGSAKTFEELDEKSKAAREKYWKGQDLPFPILLDATGATIKQYQISAFPTIVLFDPQGRLVGEATLDMLKEAVKGEVETPEPIDIK
jgi:hypothetical protein